MGTQYSLTVINNSSQSGNFYIYQTPPAIDHHSLAWLTKSVHPTTAVDFTWDPTDIGFTWARTGQLAPGVQVTASQYWPANPTTKNSVTLTKSDDAYTFENEEQSSLPNTLLIKADNTITPNEASVGIGMSGAATVLTQALPNMNYEFALTTPTYWVNFGTMMTGEIINTETQTQAQKIIFPPNCYSMTAILSLDGSWVIRAD